jgi:hypothetical protein
MTLSVTIKPNAPSKEYADYARINGGMTGDQMRSYDALLTTDHSRSSHGLPVVVVYSPGSLVICGEALGVADSPYPISMVIEVANPAPRWRDADVESIVAAAIRAGYVVVRETW